ncbi:MAG TPA: hypothetical protein VM388_08510 [Acidimicrobiales bacterium]|nr:hypothetical protein [Acidimicrobiales bacterium]
MTVSGMVRAGGVSAVAAGVLLATGHVANALGSGDGGTVAGQVLVLAAHAVMVHALFGLRLGLAGGGRTAAIGTGLAAPGTALLAAVVYGELGALNGSVNLAALESDASTAIAGGLGAIAFIAGLVLLGIAVVRSGEYPRAAGWVLVAGAVGGLSGAAEVAAVFTAAAVATGVALAWLGVCMWTGESAPTGRPTKAVAAAAVAVAVVAGAGALSPTAASAAPRNDTRGCASLIDLYDAGNPGITVAARTPHGYGACGFGTPGGPR